MTSATSPPIITSHGWAMSDLLHFGEAVAISIGAMFFFYGVVLFYIKIMDIFIKRRIKRVEEIKT